jgi:hypothetical protein
MSATTDVSPARRATRTARTGELPAPAVAAAVIAILYAVISAASLVDLIDVRPNLSANDREFVDIALWITVPLMVVLLVGIVLVFTKRSVVVLQALTTMCAVISLNMTLRSFDLLTVVNVAIPAVIAGLLGAHSVRRYFTR